MAVTTGLLERLDEEELEGVLAHEMSHIRNYDVRLMTWAAVLAGSIALLAQVFTRGHVVRRRSTARAAAATTRSCWSP